MFIEKAEIILHSHFKKELEKIADEAFESLINRANNYITQKTRFDYSKTENPITIQSLKTITWRLVDYIYYCDNEMDMENRFEGIKSENIGDYSYTIKSIGDDVGIGITGDYELDMLLDALTIGKQNPTYFSVSGPTRRNPERGGRRVF